MSWRHQLQLGWLRFLETLQSVQRQRLLEILQDEYANQDKFIKQKQAWLE